MQKGLAPFSCALASAATEGGGVLDVIYRGGVKGGIRGGVLPDKLTKIPAGYSGPVILGAATR